jgi:hypothetical protein
VEALDVAAGLLEQLRRRRLHYITSEREALLIKQTENKREQARATTYRFS